MSRAQLTERRTDFAPDAVHLLRRLPPAGDEKNHQDKRDDPNIKTYSTFHVNEVLHVGDSLGYFRLRVGAAKGAVNEDDCTKTLLHSLSEFTCVLTRCGSSHSEDEGHCAPEEEACESADSSCSSSLLPRSRQILSEERVWDIGDSDQNANASG